MPRWRLFFALFALLASTSIVVSAQQTPPPKPQTPRQALIEIVTTGAEGVVKHLTVEVQETLAKSDKKSGLAMLTGFSSMAPQKGLQTFETGPVLFAYSDPTQHIKYEVQVDNDDMNGDQDELQLSLHAFRDGQEQEQDFGLMSSRFTVSLKRQHNIWRLNNISVGVDLPVGSPERDAKASPPAASRSPLNPLQLLPAPRPSALMPPRTCASQRTVAEQAVWVLAKCGRKLPAMMKTECGALKYLSASRKSSAIFPEMDWFPALRRSL